MPTLTGLARASRATAHPQTTAQRKALVNERVMVMGLSRGPEGNDNSYKTRGMPAFTVTGLLRSPLSTSIGHGADMWEKMRQGYGASCRVLGVRLGFARAVGRSMCKLSLFTLDCNTMLYYYFINEDGNCCMFLLHETP